MDVEIMPVLRLIWLLFFCKNARHADCPKGRAKLPLGLGHLVMTLTVLRPR